MPKGINATYKVENKQYRRLNASTVVMPSFLSALEVHSTAIQAISSGSVAQGEGAVAVGEKGVLIGGDIAGKIVTGNNNSIVAESVKNAEVVTFDKAFERLSGSTAFVVEQLRISYEQTREQAKGWYRFSLIAAALGFVLIVSGAIVAISGLTTAGIITALSSIIPNVAAALFSLSRNPQMNE